MDRHKTLILNKRLIKYCSQLFLICTLILPLHLSGQFYNGSQMSFGKNRIQFQEFYWQYYRYPRYDVYYSIGGNELAQYVAVEVQETLSELESILQIENDRRIIFIIYNKLSDFRQSNLGLSTADDEYNIGGTTNIIQNKVILYDEGSKEQLDAQIRNGIVSLMVNELLYGTDSYKEIFVRSTTGDFPLWFVEGLESYLSYGWSPHIDEKARVGFLSGRYKKIIRLEGEDAVVAGHAFWHYVSQIYGNEVLSNLLYLARLSHNIENSVLYILGTDLKSLFKAYYQYYNKLYSDIQVSNDVESGTEVLKRPKRNTFYYALSASPDGRFLAYASEKMGQQKLWLLDFETGKRKKLYKHDWQLGQVADRLSPLIKWHPSGKLFSCFYEYKGRLWLMQHNVEDGTEIVKEFFKFNKILSFSYSPNGDSFVISGVNKGQSDIYVHHISSFTTKQVTNDIADDMWPLYSDQHHIIFASNRAGKTDSIAESYDLFEIDLRADDFFLKRLTETPDENETQLRNAQGKRFTYLTDKNGVSLPRLAIQDSAISSIDTAYHYRYFIKSQQLGDFNKHFYDYDIAGPNLLMHTEIAPKGRFMILLDSAPEIKPVADKTVRPYKIDEKLRKDREKAVLDSIRIDSLAAVEVHVVNEEIDINNYVFEFEKYSSPLFDSLFSLKHLEKETEVKPSVYQRHFYMNKLVNQIDFSFLNTSYQAFTGGAVYFNPGMNAFMKLGAIDLFEDYRLTGGLRLSGNLMSNEYLIQVENLQNRLDKKLVFYRKSFQQQIDQLTVEKLNDHHLMMILSYPFSEVASFRFTPGLKQTKHVYQATSYKNLKRDDLYEYWGSLKAEYVFDNSLGKQANILYKSRFKVFAEYYNLLNTLKSSLAVVGCDFRNYSKIHRNLIWAKRFAYSHSMGNSQLIYYLGSVDNWVNIFSGYETYNNKVDYDHSINWAFQTIGTNLRGFNQNIRNGNSFAVMNNEIRWPVISYIVNRPITSDLLQNFQLVGFFDIGAAWTGFVPRTEGNAYNTQQITQGPISLKIDKQRSPLVAGYGFGARTRLLGYFIRMDWAWGLENGYVMPMIYYLSLSLDF